ncbi:hypothetical protein KIL84_014492 [Mauremys mutica]|uniref:Uncharacterized protein n=1 Tax=Mauremys mutica TaxID=74926 RepID=A0A9D3XQT6_9SAUR|nr:hypothetical protein KIL84_014492 [Mauremys mutica]
MCSKWCQHTLGRTEKDTCNDQLMSKTHLKNHATNDENHRSSHSPQRTAAGSMKSADARWEFVEDFVGVCAEADIPVEKVKKLQPFLFKIPQGVGGAELPENEAALWQIHLPHIYQEYMVALLA